MWLKQCHKPPIWEWYHRFMVIWGMVLLLFFDDIILVHLKMAFLSLGNMMINAADVWAAELRFCRCGVPRCMAGWPNWDPFWTACGRGEDPTMGRKCPKSTSRLQLEMVQLRFTCQKRQTGKPVTWCADIHAINLWEVDEAWYDWDSWSMILASSKKIDT